LDRDRMIDNQLAAQLLFTHRLASQEQILSVWDRITSEKDVGMLLVEKGTLSQQTYQEMLAYMGSLAAGSPPSQAPAPVSAPVGNAGPLSHREELVIESLSGPGLPDAPPAERDPAIVDFAEENWIPVPEESSPAPRKLSRSEHALRKQMELPPQQPEPAIAPAAVSENAAEPAHPGHTVHASSSDQPGPTDHAGPVRHTGTDAPAKPAGPRLTKEDRSASDGPKVAAPASIGPGSSWRELLAFARQSDAADLHISAGNPILLRRYGALQAATQAPMDQAQVRTWVESALDPAQFKVFEAEGDLEFIYTLPHYGRYRVTLLKQRRGWDLTARVIPDRIRSMEEAGLPEPCRELTKWAQGLVLVTGPVGSGKSSTLATLVDMVNQERHDHIITIEEPIEILYPPSHCRITQRQVGPHTLSRDAALRAALREDPDIIVISELRDLDTIRLAVSAAETGHLVFGTMNTANASRTLNRLIDSFPPDEQGIVRNMISESLRGVISQQLLPRKDGAGMLPAFEVLFVTTAVANMIRKDEVHQLGTAMLTGKTSGMVLLDDSLRYMVERGLVDPAEAMCRATNPKDFEKYVGRR
jgi:twitching motility protein PilT